jgi:predicted SAM-dependent methyltransferase
MDETLKISGENFSAINLLEYVKNSRSKLAANQIEESDKLKKHRELETLKDQSIKKNRNKSSAQKKVQEEKKISYELPGISLRKLGRLKFLQIHTFYEQYLQNFYKTNPDLSSASFREQTDALIKDGFSGIHMFAPYMESQSYDAHLIIANNPYSQQQWLQENNAVIMKRKNWMYEIIQKQIDNFKPDILYFSDPIAFDSRFIRSLSWKSSLVLGWRAANIPEQTDWSEYDVMLSNLSSLRETALELGAGASEYFFPGFPASAYESICDVQPEYDVVFSGQWTLAQHARRNRYLKEITAASEQGRRFSCGYYLCGQANTIPAEVARFNLGARFGIPMYRALRTGRIAIDARGVLEIKKSFEQETVDLAGKETANMRIFEATGCGVFLLTEYFENLEQYFELGKEIETFRNKEELIEKIGYYLSNPEEREAIAQRGQRRCLQEYSMEKRAQEFDSIIQKHLIKKSKTSKCFIQQGMELPITYLMKQAIHQLNTKNHKDALNLLNEAKTFKKPTVGVDYLRSVCFLRMDKADAARESLREELRYFPGNIVAKKLLDLLLEEYPYMTSGRIGDAEFQELLKNVRPYTMLSEERLFSLFSLAKQVCQQDIPGNFVECGVAAGGSSALLASVIKLYSKQPRRLYAFDSFEGMPTPSEHDKHNGIGADATGWGTGTCAAPEKSLQEICSKIGVSEILQTVRGYFQDTLPKVQDKIGMISLLHMDGDWYESTKTILNNLYDRIVDDGLIQVDDYGFWEGCKKAIHEFEEKRDIKFQINNIDNTGIWFSKSDNFRFAPKIIENSEINIANIIENQVFDSNKKPTKTNLNLTLLNLGCGNRYHPNWTNVDFHSTGEGVIAHNLMEGLPFEDNSFDVVYHSHLIEHFPRKCATVFLRECFRVVKDGGIIRVVVPDLEKIAKHYLCLLGKSLQGDKEAQKQYEWIVLELFDQMVRNVSGGEMLTYWKQEPIPAESFVIERMGSEVLNVIANIRNNKKKCTKDPKEKSLSNPQKIGEFRLSGEIHQWMYDRFSLKELLRRVGFKDIEVFLANESQIPNFNSYFLDIESDGAVRKPDSLFMEAMKY